MTLVGADIIRPYDNAMGNDRAGGNTRPYTDSSDVQSLLYKIDFHTLCKARNQTKQKMPSFVG